MDETVALVRRSLAPETRSTFDERVCEGGEYLREEIRTGALENGDPAVGLELECYVVDDAGRLASVPDAIYSETPVNKELGVHNVEINTDPAVVPGGFDSQADAVREQLDAARERLAAGDVVLDAMWTIPPEEGTRSYLSAIETVEDVVLAENMTESPRYHALDNDVLRHAGGEIDLDLPGASVSVPSILVESLASSIQPHVQVPEASQFPAYYDAAIRTLGPVLALATNSPFLPTDLYDDVDPQWLLSETAHELRVPVFEQSINAGQERGKVCFPRDLDATADVVDYVVEDGTLVPFLQEWVEDGLDPDEERASARAGGPSRTTAETDGEYIDAFWEFDHKHGTYWRWLRGVIGGDFIDDDNTEQSIRIEYRPLPTQPSVTDVVGFQAVVAGLLEELVATDHPLPELEWDRARASFYDVVDSGFDAELHWVDAAGEHTTDADRIYAELFDLARAGLDRIGVAGSTIDRYVDPIERRWEQGRTPSKWKLDRVRSELDSGASLSEGIEAMQLDYFDRMGQPFVEWE